MQSTVLSEGTILLPVFQSASISPLPRTKSCNSPLEVFQLFLTPVILQSIVRETIDFADQKHTSFPFCVEELLAFLGLNIAMELLRLPQIRDYWSRSSVLSMPFFPSIMSRDRFQNILRYLHLNDSRGQKKRERVVLILYIKSGHCWIILQLFFQATISQHNMCPSMK